jgi:hypothetical protein
LPKACKPSSGTPRIDVIPERGRARRLALRQRRHPQRACCLSATRTVRTIPHEAMEISDFILGVQVLDDAVEKLSASGA